jgi:hypothetical protein
VGVGARLGSDGDVREGLDVFLVGEFVGSRVTKVGDFVGSENVGDVDGICEDGVDVTATVGSLVG